MSTSNLPRRVLTAGLSHLARLAIGALALAALGFVAQEARADCGNGANTCTINGTFSSSYSGTTTMAINLGGSCTVTGTTYTCSVHSSVSFTLTPSNNASCTFSPTSASADLTGKAGGSTVTGPTFGPT